VKDQIKNQRDLVIFERRIQKCIGQLDNLNPTEEQRKVISNVKSLLIELKEELKNPDHDKIEALMRKLAQYFLILLRILGLFTDGG
jgi:ribosomal protein L29